MGAKRNNSLKIIIAIIATILVVGLGGYYVFWQNAANKIRTELIDGKLKPIEESVLFKKINHDKIEISGFPFKHTISTKNVDLEFDSSDISDILGISDKFTINFKGNVKSSKPVFGKGFSSYIDGNIQASFNDAKIDIKDLKFSTDSKFKGSLIDFIKNINDDNFLDALREVSSANIDFSVASATTKSKNEDKTVKTLKNTDLHFSLENNGNEVKYSYNANYDRTQIMDSIKTLMDYEQDSNKHNLVIEKLIDDIEEKSGTSELSGHGSISIATKGGKEINSFIDLISIEKIEAAAHESYKNNLIKYDDIFMKIGLWNQDSQNISFSFESPPANAKLKKALILDILKLSNESIKDEFDSKNRDRILNVTNFIQKQLQEVSDDIEYDSGMKLSINADIPYILSNIKDIQSGKVNPLTKLSYNLEKLMFKINGKGIESNYNKGSKTLIIKIIGMNSISEFIKDIITEIYAKGDNNLSKDQEADIVKAIKSVLYLVAKDGDKNKQNISIEIKNIFTTDMKINSKPIDALMSAIILKAAPIVGMLNISGNKE